VPTHPLKNGLVYPVDNKAVVPSPRGPETS
jgi:hypothetical protein